MQNIIGSSIKRYEILEELGQGGMATVYKAFDPVLDRNVAIKIILPEKGISEKFIKRFQREAKALAALNHGNIIPIIDYGDFEGLPYLVMPYIPGGTLKQKIGQPLPYDEAAKLLIPIADALDFAHQHGVIHRDIKPSNILLDETGNPLLSDFGIAKILEIEETIDLTGTGACVGTPEYMSPEQTMGKPVDGRTDEYSLGVVFYELVTGHKPYQADTPLAIAIKQNMEALPNPRIYIPNLPDKVEQVILKALAKNPEDRYQTLDLFQNDLAELAKGKLPKSWGRGHTHKFSKTGRWIILGGFLIAVITRLLWPGLASLIQPKADSISPIPTSTSMIAPSLIPTETPLLPTSTATIQPTPALGIGSRQFSLKDGMEMVFVPAGKFMMGSPDGEGDADEHPQHEVYLDAFWIDKTEVTNAMYKKCVDTGYCYDLAQFSSDGKANGSNTRWDYYTNPAYADFPVVNINDNFAEQYCVWAGKRLPTEAEWEKSASGGENAVYPWGSHPPDSTLANFAKEINDTTQVGSYPAGVSMYGALDMVGNVWEWVSDNYASNYYQKSPPTNPTGPIGIDYNERVRRGGSFLSNAYSIRITKRAMGGYSYKTLIDVGFRCATSNIELIPTKTPQSVAPTNDLENGNSQVSATDNMKMMYVPEGEFLMGSNDSFDEYDSPYGGYQSDQVTDERPTHTVYLDAFWIDQTEITNAMFLNFVKVTNYKTTIETEGNFDEYWRKPFGPSSGLGGRFDHPVVYVSHDDAQAYCEWAGRRLPTEAEWEKAARGTQAGTYPWGEASPSQGLANYSPVDTYYTSKYINKTVSVGSYPDGASPYGVLDMAGNVGEWVADLYNPTYYEISPDINPTGPDSGDGYVIRGGSWAVNAQFLRTASRAYYYPWNSVGFRCAMDAE